MSKVPRWATASSTNLPPSNASTPLKTSTSVTPKITATPNNTATLVTPATPVTTGTPLPTKTTSTTKPPARNVYTPKMATEDSDSDSDSSDVVIVSSTVKSRAGPRAGATPASAKKLVGDKPSEGKVPPTPSSISSTPLRGDSAASSNEDILGNSNKRPRNSYDQSNTSRHTQPSGPAGHAQSPAPADSAADTEHSNAIGETLSQIKAKVSTYGTRLDAMDGKLSAVTSDLAGTMDTALAEIKNGAKASEEQSFNGFKGVLDQVESLGRRIAELGTQLVAFKADFVTLKADFEAEAAMAKGTKNAVGALDEGVRGSRGDVLALKSEVETIKRDIEAMKTGMETKADVATTRTGLEGVQAEVKEVKGAMSVLESMKGEMTTTRTGFQSLQADVKEIKGILANVKTMRGEMNTMGAGLEGVQAEVKEIRGCIAGVEEMKAMKPPAGQGAPVSAPPVQQQQPDVQLQDKLREVSRQQEDLAARLMALEAKETPAATIPSDGVILKKLDALFDLFNKLSLRIPEQSASSAPVEQVPTAAPAVATTGVVEESADAGPLRFIWDSESPLYSPLDGSGRFSEEDFVDYTGNANSPIASGSGSGSAGGSGRGSLNSGVESDTLMDMVDTSTGEFGVNPREFMGNHSVTSQNDEVDALGGFDIEPCDNDMYTYNDGASSHPAPEGSVSSSSHVLDSEELLPKSSKKRSSSQSQDRSSKSTSIKPVKKPRSSKAAQGKRPAIVPSASERSTGSSSDIEIVGTSSRARKPSRESSGRRKSGVRAFPARRDSAASSPQVKAKGKTTKRPRESSLSSAHLPTKKLGAGDGVRRGNGVWPGILPVTVIGLEQEIQCDSCNGRVHWVCAGLADDDESPDGDWYCPDCVDELRKGRAKGTIPSPKSIHCIRWDCLAKDAILGEETGDVKYYPESIVGRRKNGKDTQYLVKWLDWEMPSSTWEPPDALKNHTTLKNEFAEQCRLKDISLENDVAMLPSTRKWFDANGDLKEITV